MTAALASMKKPWKYIVPVGLLALAGISVIVVILNQPAHLQNILGEWTVQQAAQYIPTNIPDEAFKIYVLLLRYVCLGVCWLVAGVIFTQKYDSPAALVTATALWFATLAFGLAGDLTSAAFSGSWQSPLKVISLIMSLLGMVCFLIAIFILPDGKFKPGWMKYVLLISAFLIGLGFLASFVQSSTGGDWGWLALITGFVTASGAGTLSQGLRYRQETDISRRRILLPFLVFSSALIVWLILTFVGFIPETGLAAILNLHIQVLFPGVLALVVLYTIKRTQLWGIKWSANPVFMAAGAAGMLLLLIWWVARPVLLQSQVAAQQEVVVTSVPAEPKIPLIFDTDLAQDDYLALLYLLQHPAVEIKAITVSGTGEAHCNPGVSNVLSVLDQVQAPEIPVTCGREVPLEGSHAFPAEWRRGVDAFFGIKLAASQRQPSNRPASELIASILRDSSEPVIVLAVGPLTNLGELLQKHPELKDKIAHIYIMGGAVSTNGNVWLEDTKYSFAEWNIYVDPYAANLVLQSGIPVRLVPLDATNFVPVERSFKRRLENSATTPAAKLASQLMATLSPAAGPFYFWDSLAAAIVTDSNLGYFREGPIKVVEEEGPNSGRTKLDITGSKIRYATGASRTRFEGLLLAVLNLP